MENKLLVIGYTGHWDTTGKVFTGSVHVQDPETGKTATITGQHGLNDYDWSDNWNA